MADDAHRDVLDRDASSSEVDKHFPETLELTREVVNYGTKLLVRCLGGTTGEILDIVAIAVFGKQVVAALDSIEQLARTGSGLGAHVVMRALLEASLYCEWVLSSPDDRRARAYYVANLRRELTWSRRVLPDTAEHHQFRETMGDLYQDPLRDLPGGKEHVLKRVAELEAHLNGEGFSEISSEFDRLRGSRLYDSSWHRVAGAPTLRDVAKQVGRLADYTIFYSMYSDDTHGGSYKSHLEVREDAAMVYPIRSLHQLTDVLQNSLTFTFRTYRALLAKYRPDEISAYNRIYVSEWGARYRSIPRVSVQFTKRLSA